METRARLGAVPRTAAILAIVASLIITAAATFAAGSGGPQLPPTGPAGNGLIAYDAGGDIWIVGPDGSDRRQLTTGPADDVSPTWSRDGTRLAYWSVDPSGSPADLVVIRADGSDAVTVFSDEQGRTPAAGIDWSPDGTRIAFALCPDEMCGEILLADSDGSGIASVGGSAFETYRLAWSPDSTALAFGGRHAGGPKGVYLMAPDGSSVHRVSQQDGLEGFDGVSWSADGRRLVTHAGNDASGSHIWVIPADGSGDVSLTETEGGFLPVWSPDGARIAFRDGSTVFLVPTEGGDVRRMGTGESMMWSPDATSLALGGYGQLQIVDVETGDTISTVQDADVGSWQRVAQ
jgi:Tol biopolymer transport system component